MPDNRGHLLPVYVLADESYSMAPYAGKLNSGMVSLHEALRSGQKRGGVSSHVRRDQCTGRAPERVVGRQRLGVGDVERRAQPAGLQFCYQGVGIDDSTPGNIDEQCTIAHSREEFCVDKVPGGWRQRSDHHHNVDGRQKGLEFIDAVHIVVRPWPACDAHDASLEREQSPFDG